MSAQETSSISVSLAYSVIVHALVVLLSFGLHDSTAAVVLTPTPMKVSFVALPRHTTNPREGVLQPEQPTQTLVSPPKQPTTSEQTKAPKAKAASRPLPAKLKKVTETKQPTSPQHSDNATSSKSLETNLGLESAAPPSVLGVPGGTGTEIGANYEQLVVNWLAKHKSYPERARKRNLTGSAMLRLVLHRNGSVQVSEVAQSTQSRLLDEEVIQMVARATPFPPAPPNYTRRSLEFLIPVTFELH